MELRSGLAPTQRNPREMTATDEPQELQQRVTWKQKQRFLVRTTVFILFLPGQGPPRSDFAFADPRLCEEARLLAPTPLWR